jgi:hypothetical protein
VVQTFYDWDYSCLIVAAKLSPNSSYSWTELALFSLEPDKSRTPLDKPRKLPDKPRKIPDKPRKPPDKPRKLPDKPWKLPDKHRKLGESPDPPTSKHIEYTWNLQIISTKLKT